MSIESDLKNRDLWESGFQTRCGYEVEIAWDDLSGDYPIGGRYKNDGKWCACNWTAKGRVFPTGCENSMDLIRRPVKRKGWVNIYERTYEPLFGIGGPYASRLRADDECSSSRIACIEIEFTDGEGLT